MFLRSFEIDGPTLVVLSAIVLAFSLQLLLCFKTKRCLVRSIPLAVCIALALTFFIACNCASGWGSFGYLFFTLLFAALALVCGFTWGLWVLILRVGGKKP